MDIRKHFEYNPTWIFSPDGVYGELRNKVMHPVRPILNDNETIEKIDELLRDYSNIKEVLR